MALAALSAENQINHILRELDCATSNFAGIADRLSGGRVAAALSGQNDFTKDDAEYYLNVARQMKRLQDETGVPLDWRKVDRLKNILGTRKKSVQRPVPFSVVLVGSKLLKRVTDGHVEVADDYSQCAAFKDFVVARAAAKLLEPMTNDFIRCTVITNEPRSADEFVDRLTDVGFAS